jgi:hypothetical protein
MNLGEAAWHTGFPPSRSHHLAFLCAHFPNLRICIRNGLRKSGMACLLAADLDYCCPAAGTVELTEENPLPGT